MCTDIILLYVCVHVGIYHYVFDLSVRPGGGFASSPQFRVEETSQNRIKHMVDICV